MSALGGGIRRHGKKEHARQETVKAPPARVTARQPGTRRSTSGKTTRTMPRGGKSFKIITSKTRRVRGLEPKKYAQGPGRDARKAAAARRRKEHAAG